MTLNLSIGFGGAGQGVDLRVDQDQGQHQVGPPGTQGAPEHLPGIREETQQARPPVLTTKMEDEFVPEQLRLYFQALAEAKPLLGQLIADTRDQIRAADGTLDKIKVTKR